MAEETGQEKPEEPTSKRLNDAREKGDIPRSRELSATVLLLAAAASAILFGGAVANTMLGIMVDNFALDRRDLFDPARMFSHLGEALYAGFFSLWGFYLLTLLAALLSPIALGGWNFSGQAVDLVAGIHGKGVVLEGIVLGQNSVPRKFTEAKQAP